MKCLSLRIGYFLKKILTLELQEEIEKQKRELEEEKEEFKRQTQAAMVTMMQEQQRTMEAEISKKIEELEAKMKQMSTATTPAMQEIKSPEPKTKPRKAQAPLTSGPTPVVKRSSVTSRIQELEAQMKQTEAPNPLTPTKQELPQQVNRFPRNHSIL